MPKGKKRGFTTVEFAVAGAVVTATAAVLTPIIYDYAVQGQQICATNEQNIGNALALYTQDNDGQFPMLQYYDVTDTIPYNWEGAVQPYVPHNKNIWNCPSFPSIQQYEYGINWEISRDGTGTYAANNSAYNGWTLQTIERSAVKDPNEKAMVVEHGQASTTPANYNEILFDPAEYNWTNNLNIVNGKPTQPDTHLEVSYDYDCSLQSTSYNCATWGTSPGDMPRTRHRTTDNHSFVNVLYVDGHVGAIQRGYFNWYSQVYMPGVYESLDGPVQ